VKSELEDYLKENVYIPETSNSSFSVLEWWRNNSLKYKVLLKMAGDILAIPISTVASESTFSAGGRVIDEYRSKLNGVREGDARQKWSIRSNVICRSIVFWNSTSTSSGNVDQRNIHVSGDRRGWREEVANQRESEIASEERSQIKEEITHQRERSQSKSNCKNPSQSKRENSQICVD